MFRSYLAALRRAFQTWVRCVVVASLSMFYIRFLEFGARVYQRLQETEKRDASVA